MCGVAQKKILTGGGGRIHTYASGKPTEAIGYVRINTVVC